jgi:hypothetical protein
MRVLAIASLGALAALAACARQPVTAFSDRTPVFKVEDFYNGHSRGYGFFFDRQGNVVKQFTADENGTWDGRTLRLHEHYLFSDGKTQDRDWTFTRAPDGTWIGHTPDVVGETRGETSGNAYRMHYVFNLKSSGADHTLTFDDWQWMVAPKIMMNRAWGTKLGFEFGEIEATFIHD